MSRQTKIKPMLRRTTIQVRFRVPALAGVAVLVTVKDFHDVRIIDARGHPGKAGGLQSGSFFGFGVGLASRRLPTASD